MENLSDFEGLMCEQEVFKEPALIHGLVNKKGFPKDKVKEKIQKAQERLKEGCSFVSIEVNSEKIVKLVWLNEFINKIFLEEFGESLI